MCVQDVYDESLTVVEPEDAANDWQPIMLTDADMDANARSLLDWRVGVTWEPEREASVLGKLERICRARGVPWTSEHFYGTAPLPDTGAGEAMPEPEAPDAAAVAGVEEGEGGVKGRQSVRRGASRRAAGAGAKKQGKAGAGPRGGARGGKAAGTDDDDEEYGGDGEGGEGEEGDEDFGPVQATGRGRGSGRAAGKSAAARKAGVKDAVEIKMGAWCMSLQRPC
jgi:hypothetical protein